MLARESTPHMQAACTGDRSISATRELAPVPSASKAQNAPQLCTVAVHVLARQP